MQVDVAAQTLAQCVRLYGERLLGDTSALLPAERRSVLEEFVTRLEDMLLNTTLDDETTAQIVRCTRKQIADAMPTVN
jgi:hypothetical protein